MKPLVLILCSILQLWCENVDAFTASSSFWGNPTVTTTTRRTATPRHSSSTSQLSMMFDQLTSAITSVTESFGARQRMTENNIQPALTQVRRALLDADVNIQVADTLINGVRERSLGGTVTKGVSAKDQFVKAMYDELLDVMGGGEGGGGTDATAFAAGGSVESPAVIVLAGLQGAGKTTAAAKLALYLKERETVPPVEGEEIEEGTTLAKTNRKVLLVAADVYRPAAMEQLKILGGRIDVPVYLEPNVTDPVAICRDAVKSAKGTYDTVIIDTAGRQVLDDELMDELGRIQSAVKQTETLLVIDAMTGQEAARLAAAFPAITGAVLTKMDGDARGGAAVSVRAVSGQPIRFVGTGERVADLEPFYADRMASRILGMGDIVSLVEKATAAVSKEDAMAIQKKMVDATFDFDDFLKQSEMVNNMGSMANVVKMMPGIGSKINDKDIYEVEQRLKKNKAMIKSMTDEERKNPNLLIADKSARTRLIRITEDSGMTLQDGLQFVSEFQKMRTMMSRMQKMGSAAADLPPEEAAMSFAGNRATRRAAKKNKKKLGGSGGGGFG